MPRLHVKALAFLTIILPAAAWAQSLEWEKPRVAIIVSPSGGKTACEFRFTNKSNQPVRIKAAPASCSCVAPKPDKRAYAPGESGLLPVTYSPKGRPGLRAYRLYVVTDEKGIRPYELVLEVNETSEAEPEN